MSTPIAGVKYWFDSVRGVWSAPGREELSALLSETGVVAGALPIGTADYDIPATNVIYLSTTGNNANPGTEASPKATLAGAISAATAGGTIVIRGGEYRENAGTTSKSLTIQNYPGEAVWFDGTDVESTWTVSASTWYATNTFELSHIAGHSQGSPDDPTRWADAQNPIAHYTDMCFIDGVRQWQVTGTPVAGQFMVDYAADRVYIGTNPSGKTVRIGKRTKMLHVSAPCTIRGIGWRRYCTEMWELGTVYVSTAGGGSTIENCHMVDVATQPLCIIGDNCLVTSSTIIRPGQTGIHVNQSDGSTFEKLTIREHNWEKFRTQPHCGGIKVTFSGNTTIQDCWIDGATNRAVSIWFDASNWEGKVVNNYTVGGYGGIFLEASGRFIIAGNRMQGNANTYHGFLLTISKEMKVWNNWADRANGYLYANWQDNRSGPYERFNPPAGNWWSVDNRFVNNVVGGSKSLFAFYNRRDSPTQGLYPYDQMVLQFESNYFAATAGQNPPVSTPRLAGFVDVGSQVDYTQIATFQAAKAWATNNKMTTIQSPNDAEMAAFTGAVPLPSDVATAMGVTAGTIRIGPPRPVPVPLEGP